MNAYFIKSQDFNDFIGTMMKNVPVVGPVAKATRFVFSRLERPEDLRLDYDVTVLPPKKEFFPTCQVLCKFDANGYTGCIKPEKKVLFGVHFYDIKAIDMTDYLFKENNPDANYLANREATTIVGSNIQKVFKRAFWGTVGKEVKPQGHDAFITKLSDGYVFEAFTPKGEELVKHGKCAKASDKQLQDAWKANQEMLDKCPEKLKWSSEEIKTKVRSAFKNDELWESLAHDCFSCGSCNTTCPTCYCFDVQDNWNVDQVSGERVRTWDACLTEDFAQCSLGGGHHENFRETRGSRFRHRMMRKAAYLNVKLGGPACVGCGRCSSACTADIADPVEVINKIMGA